MPPPPPISRYLPRSCRSASCGAGRGFSLLLRPCLLRSPCLSPGRGLLPRHPPLAPRPTCPMPQRSPASPAACTAISPLTPVACPRCTTAGNGNDARGHDDGGNASSLRERGLPDLSPEASRQAHPARTRPPSSEDTKDFCPCPSCGRGRPAPSPKRSRKIRSPALGGKAGWERPVESREKRRFLPES